jgi:parallel beta-helix repeat protein
MKWKIMLLCIACAAALTAQTDTFTSIEYPEATQTYANGISDGGDIVGQYISSSGETHGFLLTAGKFTQVDYPGAKSTLLRGINSQGDAVGSYVDTGGKTHGLILSKGAFTSLDYAGAALTGAIAINSAGAITGHIQLPGKPMQGFLLSGGVWTIVDYRPDAPSNTMNCYFGINDAGVMVGHWGTRGSLHGVAYKGGAFTQIDYGGGGQTEAVGINAAGDIVGDFQDVAQGVHGFLLKNGRFTQIDYPGSGHTMAYGINASGQIVGHFQDANQNYHGFVARLTPAGPVAPVLTVDDDGLDCPGALRTIQEAVAQAPGGSTILVCPGTYRGTVNIIGPEKTALKLIAVGREDEVVLQGDYTQRDGFHLENVTNVLIRGFTVRDFGTSATTAADWGVGNQIYLENADYNTIENNRLINGDMVGIMVMNSGHNTVQRNFMKVVNSGLANCGIHVEGARSSGNVFAFNNTFGAKMAGIMIARAGTGNRVLNNSFLSNGRDGIYVSATGEVWIEGNRSSYNRGPWGTTPYPKEALGEGFGIRLLNSNKSTVLDNRAVNNTGADLSWDGNGENRFEANACGTSTPSGACAK